MTIAPTATWPSTSPCSSCRPTTTPAPRKLGIKPDTVIALLGAPEGFEEVLEPLPETVRIKRSARGAANLILLFARSRADMERRFPAAARCLAEGGGLWIAWPKKACGSPTLIPEEAPVFHRVTP